MTETVLIPRHGLEDLLRILMERKVQHPRVVVVVLRQKIHEVVRLMLKVVVVAMALVD